LLPSQSRHGPLLGQDVQNGKVEQPGGSVVDPGVCDTPTDVDPEVTLAVLLTGVTVVLLGTEEAAVLLAGVTVVLLGTEVAAVLLAGVAVVLPATEEAAVLLTGVAVVLPATEEAAVDAIEGVTDVVVLATQLLVSFT